MEGWLTVYQIAGQRHGTRMGFGHLSEHGMHILQMLAVEEHERMKQEALGEIFSLRDLDPSIFVLE